MTSLALVLSHGYQTCSPCRVTFAESLERYPFAIKGKDTRKDSSVNIPWSKFSQWFQRERSSTFYWLPDTDEDPTYIRAVSVLSPICVSKESTRLVTVHSENACPHTLSYFIIQISDPGHRLHTSADEASIVGEAMATVATTAGEVTIKATITLTRAITEVKFAEIHGESQAT